MGFWGLQKLHCWTSWSEVHEPEAMLWNRWCWHWEIWARFPLTFWSARVILTVSEIFSELTASYFEMSSSQWLYCWVTWPLTSPHSTPPVTWSAWGVTQFLFSLIPQNELTFVTKSLVRWLPLNLSQKLAWFSWPWHLGHLKSHEAVCIWESNPPWAELISSAPILLWGRWSPLESPWSLLWDLESPEFFFFFGLSFDLVLLFLDLLCGDFVDVLHILWQDPFEHDIFLDDIFWAAAAAADRRGMSSW